MIDFNSRTTEKGTLVISVGGRLNEETNGYFFDCVKEEIQNGNRYIVINCADLGHISSVGLGALVRARSRAAKAGGVIYLAHLDATMMDLFRLVRFDRLFDIFPTEHEAIEAIEKGDPSAERLNG
jgi:anti-sigma B factor antagonist